MEFGIWFEPEMVNERSELYQAHPEWVVRPPKGRCSVGRSQLVLDFSNPKTVQAIYSQIQKVLIETGASYIKWDMNRDITKPGPDISKRPAARRANFSTARFRESILSMR